MLEWVSLLMSMNQLRVGIIGAGQAGERHAAGFGELPNAQVVGIADLDTQRAAQLAAPYGATVYGDWREMLAAGLDILVVALPHSMHVAPTEAAAKAGVHVMMEKPIATTLADGRRIVELCATHNVKLATSFAHRYRDECQMLYGWVREGILGTPVMARETMNIERGESVPKWVMSQALGGGGVIMYSAVHAIDRLRWLVGSEVTKVTAQTYRLPPETEVEDAVSALLTFANGASATLVASAPTYPARPTIWEGEVIGTLGMGRLRNREWAQMSNQDGQFHQDTTSVPETLGQHYNFVRQSAAFLDAIVNDSVPPASGDDGLAVLEIALAIYESARLGRSVEIAELQELCG